MTDTDDRPLNPDEPYYTWTEYDGHLSIASECCGDQFSESEEKELLAYLLKKHPVSTLNSADWQRIEAAVRDLAQETDILPAGPAYARTLDKVQRHNQTGKYTPQGGITA